MPSIMKDMTIMTGTVAQPDAPQRHRQQAQVQDQDAGGVARVGDGDGRAQDALAGAHAVVEDAHVLVHLGGGDGVGVGGLDDLRHDLHAVVGPVRGAQESLQLVGRQHALQLHARVALATQVHLEAAHQSHRPALHHGAVLGRHAVRAREPGAGLAVDVARAVNDLAPDA